MMNLNSKELKNFRDTLALWHIADFRKADADIDRSKLVKSLNTIIETDYERLKKIEKGEVTLGNASDIKAEIQANLLRIEAEKARVSALKEEFDKDTQKGLALLTDALIDSVLEYTQSFSDEAFAMAQQAFVKWFTDNGANGVVADDVSPIVRQIGVKVGSSFNKCKNNAHTVTIAKRQLKPLVLSIVCDDPRVVKMLPTHKWNNVIETRTRKK